MEMSAAALASHVRKEFAQDHRRAKRSAGPTAAGGARARARADRRRAGTGEDARRQIAGAYFPSAVPAGAVHARPDSRATFWEATSSSRPPERFRLHRGPIFTDLLLVDEINRMPPRTQSALLEAMEELQVTIDGTSHRALPVVYRLRDAESGGIRGNLSAAGSAARPIPDEDSHRLSRAGAGVRNTVALSGGIRGAKL